MSIVGPLILQFILILLNAFFAAAEIALLSINEKKVRSLADDGDKKAKKLIKIIENPTKFLSTIQIGITLAGFLGSAFAADNFAEGFAAWLLKIFNISPVHAETLETVSVIIITLILSYFTLVLGELVPKRVAMRHKEKVAGVFCRVISVMTAILRPIVWFLTVSTNVVLRIFGIDPNEKEEAVSEEDIVIMLDAGADEGALDQDDVEYIKNVFKLDRLTAADVMTQRSSIVAIPQSISDEDLLTVIAEEGYSRIPVYSDSIDKIVGVLHTREYLLRRGNPDFKLEDVMFSPVYVPETIKLDALFKEMQDSHNHIVIVVNEYGFTSGVVSMEDIIEELVGEIWDEQDEEIESISQLSENTYKVLSNVSIDEFFSFFELERNDEIASTTVNGWLNEHCGNIPEEGFSLDYENLSVCVTKADDIMTHELEVTVLEKELPPEEEKDAE